MILDAESLELVNAIESLLEPAPSGEIKPELMESVLEVSHRPLREHDRGRRADPRAAQPGRRHRRRQGDGDRLSRDAPVRDVGGPADRGAVALPRPDLGAAVRRPPGADLRDARPRRRSTTLTRRSTWPTGCAFTADAARRCRPIRRSGARTRPGWRRPGCRSSAPFPRIGIPPTYDDWDDYERRIDFMVKAEVIEDYTFLWYDVRPHPKFGTVEIRAMDSQTRIEHTLGAGGAGTGDGPGAVRALRRRRAAVALSVRDARREQVAGGPPRARRRARRPAELTSGSRTRALARRLIERLARAREDWVRSTNWRPSRTCWNGATGRPAAVVYEANHDLHEVMARGRRRDRRSTVSESVPN